MNKISLLSLFLVLQCSMVIAQNAVSSNDKGEQGRKKNYADIDSTGVRIFLEKIDILGRIEKPQTVFILPGKDPGVDDIEIDRSFFREIFRPVERDILRAPSTAKSASFRRSLEDKKQE